MAKQTVLIVGGGAAGFFTAANLDASKFHTILLEQSTDVLQKVRISGGGRCNVTHSCFEPSALVQYYPRGNRELRSVFSRFQPQDTIRWFSQRGVVLKTEKDGRIFPQTNSSETIIDVLKKQAALNGTEIKLQHRVLSITPEEGGYTVHTSQGDFWADCVVYTPGSIPKSLKILQDLSFSTVAPVPSLFTFNISHPLLEQLPGTSFPNAQLSIPEFKSKEQGPLLITHWGLSGPAILKISAWKARELFAADYRFTLHVNFLAEPFAQVQQNFVLQKQSSPKKLMSATKPEALTQRFWSRALDLCGIDPTQQIGTVKTPALERLTALLTQCKLEVVGKSTNKDEFVTAGGVDLKEIDFRTMESKRYPNFFLAGEILNIDGITGGFNFQACWSEAFVIATELNARF